jgi:hypothetical protein
MQTTTQTAHPSFSTAGIIWLKLAVVYLILGVVMGIAMGATETFTLKPVHAHINLLGWATMGLAGLIYSVFPQAGESKLAKLHFWLHNISLPAMMISLSFLMLGETKVIPVLGISEIGAGAGILVFAANIFLNLKKA